MAQQVLADTGQVLLRLAILARQGENPRIGMQQARAVELVECRKQFAQGQIAQRAEQGKSTGFNGYRRHDVCSFIKLS
ncbi:hypothetical protein D3C86_1804300 [compost metagenome]